MMIVGMEAAWHAEGGEVEDRASHPTIPRHGCQRLAACHFRMRCVIGAISGLLGINGKGADFTAASANVINPLTQLQQPNAQAGQAANLVANTAQSLAPASLLGLQRQNQTYGQMQQLAQQLSGQAQGTGPNPALAQLANTTGQNVAQTAALMAGARGSSANPGLIARQAAQQGAAIQQDATGQAAALRAQQQLAAQQQLQQQQAALSGLATTQVGEGLNAAATGANAANAYSQNLAGQVANYNQANVSNTSQKNAADAGIQQVGAKALPDVLGGLAKGAGSAIALAAGGEVGGPRSHAGKHLNLRSGGKVPGKAKVAGDSYANDTVDAKLSPGEVVVPRSVMQSEDPARSAAAFVAAVMAKRGRR